MVVDKEHINQCLTQFTALCRQQGLPVTVQRREILKAVLQRDDHPTAEAVYESVKDRVAGLSRTTVYRVLDRLVDLGVIRRLHHPGTTARFDGNMGRHHHLVCRICNQTTDIDSPTLNDLELPSTSEHAFQVEDYSVHIIGICKDCRKSKRKTSQS